MIKFADRRTKKSYVLPCAGKVLECAVDVPKCANRVPVVCRKSAVLCRCKLVFVLAKCFMVKAFGVLAVFLLFSGLKTFQYKYFVLYLSIKIQISRRELRKCGYVSQDVISNLELVFLKTLPVEFIHSRPIRTQP